MKTVVNRIFPLVPIGLVVLIALNAPEAAVSQEQSSEKTHDVVVYGGTSAGIAAALQAKRMGKSVVVVSPDIHLGGLTAGGLGWTDSGNKTVVGGIAREFYGRIWQHYEKNDAWKWQTRKQYGGRGQGGPGARRQEPHDVDFRAPRGRSGIRGDC